jgi:hypothetical protein
MPVAITPSAVRALADVAKPYRARQVPAGSSKPARLLRGEFDGARDRSEALRGLSVYRVIPRLLGRSANGATGVQPDRSEEGPRPQRSRAPRRLPDDSRDLGSSYGSGRAVVLKGRLNHVKGER